MQHHVFRQHALIKAAQSAVGWDARITIGFLPAIEPAGAKGGNHPFTGLKTGDVGPNGVDFTGHVGGWREGLRQF
ncbi:hypothetical protein D3C80_1800280 [compost metagenome]